MTKTFIGIVALAAACRRRRSAEYHRHLEHGPGGRPRHSGRARPQAGRTKLTGTIALPTQNAGDRVEVQLSGEFAEGAFKLSGTVEGRQGADDARHQRQAPRRRLDGRQVRDARARTRRHVVDGRAAEGEEVARPSRAVIHACISPAHTCRDARSSKELGATIALPFLDAMAPAGRGLSRAPGGRSAWSASRWCTAPREARRSAHGRTSGRPRVSAATSISGRRACGRSSRSAIT